MTKWFREATVAAGVVQVKVRAAPEQTWEIVGAFGDVMEWVPGIESLRLEGDDRFVGMFGTVVQERLLSRDAVARTITYSVISPPIANHRATMTVEPDDEGSMVTWTFEVTPDEMAPVLHDIYELALESLQAKLAQ